MEFVAGLTAYICIGQIVIIIAGLAVFFFLLKDRNSQSKAALKSPTVKKSTLLRRRSSRTLIQHVQRNRLHRLYGVGCVSCLWLLWTSMRMFCYGADTGRGLNFGIEYEPTLPKLSSKGGMLYPKESETREVKELNGMWEFRADMSPNRNEGFERQWFSAPLSKSGPVIPMPVPSSFNDITADKALRDFVGWVWYEREFFVSSDWQSKRIVLRVDSAHYFAIVYINGREMMRHEGGHLPFEVVVNEVVSYDGPNRLTIALNNTLTPTTLPPGTITYKTETTRYPAGYFVQNVQFDFFNYAGIHRSVRLYTTPTSYIDDITVGSEVTGTTGIVSYAVSARGAYGLVIVKSEVIDRDGNTVATMEGQEGQLYISNAKLWWPYTMSNEDYAYMYTLKVTLHAQGVTDVYRLPFGVRTVQVTEKQLLINNKPFYCLGVGKHEDADIRGKGLDFATIARDFYMLKWMGANCFRTSHYPYAEEIMDQADQLGIVVIDESPGVGIQADDNFGNTSLYHHLEVMDELVRRDKNRPAVIIWSVANEPKTSKIRAEGYFRTVILHTKRLDPTRPVTFVAGPTDFYNDRAAQFVDILMVNRYYGWYGDTGHTEVIEKQVLLDLRLWHQQFTLPVMVTEYGADTIMGLNQEPSFVFTESFQVDFMHEYHNAFDILRKEFLVGEMVWNFADFMTDQEITRVVGNKKGILTRQRQPKMAAYLLRGRYWDLINGTVPTGSFMFRNHYKQRNGF